MSGHGPLFATANGPLFAAKADGRPLFCENCGVGSFSRGTGPDGSVSYAINVRCLDGVDPSKLTITPFDGKSM